MTKGEGIGVKAISTILATVIVLTVLLAITSALYAGLVQLGNEAHNLVKREAERAMESFFQIYWLNNTHVALFNNHSSVSVTLLYWVSINPSSGAYTVTPTRPVRLYRAARYHAHHQEPAIPLSVKPPPNQQGRV
jgi:hypothetical protein